MNDQIALQSGKGLLSRRTALIALLVCGILSSVVYVATDVLAAMRWEGYRYADRSVSELLAVGAPTRAFVVPPMTAYNVLVVAFGIGVWALAERRRALRVTGILLVLYGVASLMGLTLFPLRPDSSLSSTGQLPLSGALHAGITIALVLLMFLFIGFGSVTRGKGFRLYSIVTILAILAGGVLAGMLGPRLAAGLVTPGFGLLERLNIYSSLLWVLVFAVLLLRAIDEYAPITDVDALGEVRPKKKVTAFVGSAHKGGATYTATRRLLDDLESFGDVHGEIIVLSDYDVGTCRGCQTCFERGEERCPLKDDRDVLIEKMMDSDAVVFASPNYSFQVSAFMKIFLDRLGFVFHRPRFHGKTATSIVVQGIYGGRKVRKYLEFVAGGLGFNVVRGSVVRTLEPMTEKSIQQRDKALAEQSRRFHAQLLRPANPAPSLFGLMAFRLSRTSIKSMLGEDQRDYVYYREKGWFESDYYYPTHLGPLKKAAGAVFDWAGARMSGSGGSDAPAIVGPAPQ